MNIGQYLPRRTRDRYSQMFTERQTSNCFSIISGSEYQELYRVNMETHGHNCFFANRYIVSGKCETLPEGETSDFL